MANPIQKIILIIILIFIAQPVVYAVSVADLVDNQIEKSNLRNLDKYTKNLDESSSFSFSNKIALVKSDFNL